jgi:Bacterial Ig domain
MSRFLRSLVLLPVLVLAIAAPAAASGLPTSWDKGFDFTAWWNNGYSTANADTSFANLTTTGANAIALTPAWYQDTINSNVMAPDASRTPTDASLTVAVQRAKAKGIRVMLRPIVDPLSGGYRGQFAPSSPATWFANYRAMVDHYADLARSLGVDSLSVGVELKTLTTSQYDAYWRQIIADVRARFSGWLTYSSSAEEYKQIGWWDALDRIGVDAYFSLATGATPSEDTVVAAWSDFVDQWGYHHHYLDDLAAASAKWSKPVVFTELGYASRLNALVDPWNKGGTYSALDQQVGYNAALRALADKPWFTGVYVWHWWAEDPTAIGPGNTDHSPQNKPGQTTLTSWFTGSSTPPPPPPPNAAPTVSLTAPTGGQLFRSSLGMAASASDDGGVTKVEFYLDGRLLNTDTTAPYAYSYRAPKKLSYATHTVKAKAYDAAGLVTTSAPVSVTRSTSAAT